LPQDLYLSILVKAFLTDRKAQNLSPRTIRFYRLSLEPFVAWCDTQAAKLITDLTPDLLRDFLIHLEGEGLNPGGRHAYYRSLRAFLRWYAEEFEPLQWKNPMLKVKPPRVDVEPLAPVPMETVRAMLATCDDTFTGRRDRAIILFLLDSGVRAGELLALDLPDVDLLTGDVLIRKSKSRKPRTVFIGRTARKALRAYLKLREDYARAVFVTNQGERLKTAGLRQIMVRRSKRAKVPVPSLHSFRRAFALAMKRAGVDLLSIARLLGHSDLSLLQRYIKQSADDLRDAHGKASPVDGIL
jgi:site-specific recombinase XerD